MLVIVTPEPTSMSDAYATIKVVNQYDPDLKVGIIVNMVTGEAGAKKVFETLQSNREILGRNSSIWGSALDKHMSFAVRAQSRYIKLP